jgi:predicted nucleotidyltransferase
VDDAHDGPYAREPQVEDLVRICRALNDAGARYLLIGGFAVIAHGGARTTMDIDLLVDASPENVARVKEGLRILEDRAVDEVADTDIGRYAVVRVADEIVIDLMALACGIDYSEAAQDSERLTVDGVSIPLASPETLIRTKNTVRPSDAVDRRYLEELLRAKRREPGLET